MRITPPRVDHTRRFGEFRLMWVIIGWAFGDETRVDVGHTARSMRFDGKALARSSVAQVQR